MGIRPGFDSDSTRENSWEIPPWIPCEMPWRIPWRIPWGSPGGSQIDPGLILGRFWVDSSFWSFPGHPGALPRRCQGAASAGLVGVLGNQGVCAGAAGGRTVGLGYPPKYPSRGSPWGPPGSPRGTRPRVHPHGNPPGYPWGTPRGTPGGTHPVGQPIHSRQRGSWRSLWGIPPRIRVESESNLGRL